MFRNFIITKITTESTAIKSFYLKRADDAPLEDYFPGQFISVRVKPNGVDNGLIRNYTLSDSPKKNYFRLTIKRESNGIVSKHFHDVIKTGDVIELSKPTGNFYLSINNPKPAVLLSGGVGITPMLSMLEHITENEPDKKVFFLHSSTNKDVQPMLRRLKELKLKHRNIFLSIHHTKPKNDEVPRIDYDYAGAITKEHLKKLLPGTEPDFYLCGPVNFMETMFKYLLELGINEDSINYEFFGEGKNLGNQKQIEKLGTKIDTKNFKIHFTKSLVEADWDSKNANILELAESVGISPQYSCRMGTCSTCETTLLKGSVEYDPEPFMENPAGKIFICCAKPTSDIELEL